MTKNRLLIALAVVALLGASVLAAQDDSQPLTSTVVSATPTSLVIKTADKQKSFILDADSQTPASLSAGNEVTVEFHQNDQGEMVASYITIAEAGMEEPQVAETTPAAEESPVAETEPGGDTVPAATEPESTPPPIDQTAENAEPAATSLPATGSKLPLIGLLSLAALAGGLVLRRIH